MIQKQHYRTTPPSSTNKSFSSSCWENRLFVSFADQKFHHFTPIEIDDPFEHMICTAYLCIVSTMKGKVYCLDNRLDNGVDECKLVEMAYSDEFKQDESRIKFLIAGFYHVIVVKESKKIYAYSDGVNSDDGEIGIVIGAASSAKYHLVQIKTDHFIGEKSEITHAVCGTNSLIIVLDNKELYITGRLRESTKDFIKKTVDEHDPLIETVSVGYDNIIVKTLDGNFYCGENEYGQLFSYSATSTFEKLELEDHVLNLKALRLSHLTCKVTPNRLDIYGYIENAPTEDYKVEKDYHCSQMLNGYDIEPFGGFTTVVICNNRKKQLMAFGSTSNAPSKPYNILDKIKTDHSNLAHYIDNHEVRYAHCGSNIIGFMMGSPQSTSLLLVNLHKMYLYTVKEALHSSNIVPCSDVIIK